MPFNNEKEGQIEFYNLLNKINGSIPLYDDFTDGTVGGTILEFKLRIDNINSVLLQAIKYLSKKRNNGKDIPSQILLVSLNEEKAYLYKSNDFLKDIEKQYIGSASINNNSYYTDIKPEIIEYSQNLKKIAEILENNEFIKINIDLYCVIGYANRFYNENPTKKKIDFFNELRDPKTLPIYPWQGHEEDFKYIMDCLNDNQHKKELGAFYTPKEYVRLSTKLVREAIKKIKKTNNDYIILDRCAGTGNLEQFFTDKDVKDIIIQELDKYLDEETIEEYLKDKNKVIKMINKNFNLITMGELENYKTSMSIYDYLFDNELSHVIVNTYELKEWVVLNSLIGDKVKMIIPPLENVKQNEDLVHGGDALSEYFITGQNDLDLIQTEKNKKLYSYCINELNSYVKNPNINIIMLENPPYRDTSAGDMINSDVRKKESKNSKNSFVYKCMKNDVKGATLNDIANQFIWSAQKYYLKKENDFFILYSPVKYFKSIGLINKHFVDGYLLNRQYFHASPSAISLIIWQNIEKEQEEFELKAYDINKDEKIEFVKNIKIKKCHNIFSGKYYHKQLFKNDLATKCWSGSDGYIAKSNLHFRTNPIYNENIVGYLVSAGFSIDPKHVSLTRQILFNGNGFYLRSDNYITKLPLFCAKLYPQENWYERDIYFTTADKGEEYLKDKDLLKSCLIYTCLCRQNKCISFYGSDGRFYKNELCFDGDTIAGNDIKNLKLNKDEEELFKIWNDILLELKKTKNYNSNYSYGLYQIDKECNTYYKLDINNNKIFPDDRNWNNKKNSCIYYDYIELNSSIISLKEKLKLYYKNYIQDKLFKYELLK